MMQSKPTRGKMMQRQLQWTILLVMVLTAAVAWADDLEMALVPPAEPFRLVDTLLVGAFIEARSCERFALLVDDMTAELAALGPCELRPALADPRADLDHLAEEVRAHTTADPEVTHG